LGILLGNSGGSLNQPVQETGSGVDVVNTNSGYTAVFGKNSTVIGTGISLITAFTRYSVDGKNISQYDPSLVGYWDMESLFNTKIKDFSKNGNDGIVNNIIGITPGRYGNAVQFSGSTINTGNSSSLDITGSITLETWIKPNGLGITSQNYSRMFIAGKTRSTYQLAIYGAYGDVSFWISDHVYDAPGLIENIWNHIIVTYNGSIVKIYNNGNLLLNTPVSWTITSAPIINAAIGLG
jgi:hypothetical protein